MRKQAPAVVSCQTKNAAPVRKCVEQDPPGPTLRHVGFEKAEALVSCSAQGDYRAPFGPKKTGNRPRGDVQIERVDRRAVPKLPGQGFRLNNAHTAMIQQMRAGRTTA